MVGERVPCSGFFLGKSSQKKRSPMASARELAVDILIHLSSFEIEEVKPKEGFLGPDIG